MSRLWALPSCDNASVLMRLSKLKHGQNVLIIDIYFHWLSMLVILCQVIKVKFLSSVMFLKLFIPPRSARFFQKTTNQPLQ